VVFREEEQVLRTAMMNLASESKHDSSSRMELAGLMTMAITFSSIRHLFKSFSIIKNSDPSSKFSAICGTTSTILALPTAS
jgi:hypothetical protein